MSGHSKWATIKHKKGAADAKRGRLFTKLIREITVAAKMGGGDVTGNPRLRKAVADAKAQSMPADTITRAVKRGTGELEGVTYEEITYEGTGPGGSLFIVETMTDNRNRTIAEFRKIFEKHNGAMGTSAGWAFDRKGVITLEKSASNEDQLMDCAVGAGADDYSDDGEEWSITTPPEKLDTVLKALEAAKVPVKSSGLQMVAKTPKTLTGRDAEVALNLVDALDEHDDTQNVYSDFDVSEEDLKRLSE